MMFKRSLINDLSANVTDGEHASVKDDENGAYFLLSNKNIKSGKIVYDEYDRKISESTFLNINRRTKLSFGDVVISTVGSIGKTAVIKDDFINFDFQRSVGIIKPDQKKLNAEYLHYYFQIPTVQKRLVNLSKGAVQKCLFISDLRGIEIDHPTNIEDQEVLVAVLKSIDSKIELNNRINADLEAMAKTIYDYWFVQFDFPDKNGKPYKTSGGKMVWNAELKREIPEGWEVRALFSSCVVQYGFPFSTNYFNDYGKGLPVIRIRDILDNTISNYSTEGDVNSRYLIKKGDVLIGMDGNFHVNYWSINDCYLNQRVVKLSETILPNIYLRYQVEPYIKLREQSVSRTTVGHLSDKDMRAIPILKPDDRILEIINDLFKKSLDKILTNRNENEDLKGLRDWLLPMLMNGQVRIN